MTKAETIVQVRLTYREREEWKRIAAAGGLGLSQVIRHAVRSYLGLLARYGAGDAVFIPAAGAE